jgi:hypothetical protein
MQKEYIEFEIKKRVYIIIIESNIEKIKIKFAMSYISETTDEN